MTMPDEHASAPDEDAALMMEAAGGSMESLAALVRRHQNPLVNFFRRMGVRNDAEDLVQETFVRVYKMRRRYRPAAKFTTFLYVVARRVLADHGRKWFRLTRLREGLAREGAAGKAAGAPSSRGAMDVEAALERLSPKLRSVVVLSIYQGLRQEEVARILGIPCGTVKSRMNLAIKALREYFNEGG